MTGTEALSCCARMSSKVASIALTVSDVTASTPIAASVEQSDESDSEPALVSGPHPLSASPHLGALSPLHALGLLPPCSLTPPAAACPLSSLLHAPSQSPGHCLPILVPSSMSWC
jgi:hypothetical protein